MATIATLTANILVTWICQDGTLKDCEIYQREIKPPLTCEAASENVLRTAQMFKLPETIITYCTNDAGLSDLPIERSN